MRRFYEASDRIEAQRLVDYLQDYGIPAVILGDFLSGAAGDLPANIYPAVWLVEDVHWLRANALLEGFLQPADQAADWICRDCGEKVEGVFEVCWNCGRHRSE